MLATHQEKYTHNAHFFTPDPPYDVAVIGAGASGALVAAQFRRNAPTHSRLALISADPYPARGIAYETPYRSHLLNVRAGNMSAFPDDMDHFLRWLQYRNPDAHAKTFAPRSVYGDYLADLINTPLRGFAQITQIRGTAVDMSKGGGVWAIYLDNGAIIRAQTVVLALGNLPPNDPLKLQNKLIPSYWRNPWAADIALGLPPQAPVLLIGTGTTMADVVMTLRDEGHQGHVYAISRHGRIPKEHSDFARRPLQKPPAGLTSPIAALRWLRKEIEVAKREGYNWRAVIDGLRPHTATIWRSWTLAQRASFLRHARNLWDVHRHRIAPEIYQHIQQLLRLGVLSIHAGRLDSLYTNTQGFTITWKPAGSKTLETLQVARIINCSGPSRDYARADLPVIVSLRRSGWLTPDKLRLGVETDNDGRLIDVDGAPVNGLFAIGSLRIPSAWESTAIPEIRLQAAALVKLLISNLIDLPVSS